MVNEPSPFLKRLVPPLPQQLAEALPGPALLCDGEGRVRAWNRAAQRATGYPPEEMLGLDPATLFRGGQRRAFEHQMRLARETGIGDLILPFQFPGGPSPEFRFHLLRLGEGHDGWIALVAGLARGAQARREAGTFGNLVNDHPDGLLVLRAQAITYANPAAAELLGFPEPEAVNGLSLAYLVFREDRPAMGRLLARAARDERPEARIRLLDAERQPHPVSVRLALIEGRGSRPTIQMVLRTTSAPDDVDATLRRNEERNWFLLNRALRNSEQRFEHLLERGLEELRGLRPVPASSTGPQDDGPILGSLLAEQGHGYWQGTLQSGARVVNEPLAELVGADAEALTGQPFTELVTPGEAPRIQEILAGLGQGAVECFETRLRATDGQGVTVTCRALAGSGGGPGEAPIHITVTDSSVKTETPAQLNWKNALYESLFDQLPGFLLGISTEGHPTYWSPSLPERFHLSPEKLAATPVSELVAPGERETFQRLLQKTEKVPFATMEVQLGEGAKAAPYRLFLVALPGEQAEAHAILGINLAEAKNINPPLAGARARLAMEDRQTLERTLEREVLRSRRYGNAFSVLLIEADGLEEIAEHYGAGWGDVIADQLQEVVEKATRGPDLVGRWEDRRIVVIAPETGATSAGALATKIRKQVHEHDFDPVAWVRVRIGRASYRMGERSEDLLTRAQRDLDTRQGTEGDRTLA